MVHVYNHGCLLITAVSTYVAFGKGENEAATIP